MNKLTLPDRNTHLETVKHFYKEFDKNNVAHLDQIYANHIIFIDPFHHIEGIDKLKNYFMNLAENINYCHFDFKHEATNNDDVFLQWRMEFSHRKIKNGSPLETSGISHLVMNEKIVFHRDYFDSSEMLYKHLPILGPVIRLIEKNMGN